MKRSVGREKPVQRENGWETFEQDLLRLSIPAHEPGKFSRGSDLSWFPEEQKYGPVDPCRNSRILSHRKKKNQLKYQMCYKISSRQLPLGLEQSSPIVICQWVRVFGGSFLYAQRG